jgi:hypothetical protein
VAEVDVARDIVLARWRNWRPGDWAEDIEFVCRHGLTADDVADAIYVAQKWSRQNYWSYFMGVCRNKIKEKK